MMRFGSYNILNRGIILVASLFYMHSSVAQTDSTDFYEKIKDVAYKRKFTIWLYNAIFVAPAPLEYPTEPAAVQKKNVNPYLKHKNQIIRNINIRVYNPFGHKVEDTVKKFDNFVENTANHIHVNTRRWIVINRLLFTNNDTVNALEFSESERLLRQAPFVNDAKITIHRIPHSDSVDVNVEVYDKWPITAPSYVDAQGGNIRFINQNLFGVGQQFEQYVGFKTPDIIDYRGSYTIGNIDNTYISSQLAYVKNKNGTTVGLAFDRPYFSPLAEWAGGASCNHSWGYYPITDTVEGIDKNLTLNTFGYDIWAGRSFKLRKTKTIFNQSTNIIVGERYYENTFLARPSFDIDTSKFNLNTYNFVGNIGISLQQYYKDKFIYRFGSNEDVPEGLIMQMTYGLSRKEFSPLRYYLGGEIARAKKFSFGYMTSTISYGVFFNKYITNNITTRFKLYYLSNLAKRGKWYFREFVTYDIVNGQNKPSTEMITLNSDELYGFNSGTLKANTKMILNFETVAYAPFNVIGFKFAPVVTVGLGMVATPQNRIENSPLYQAYSIGLLIRNEHLVSSTFQISIGLYPFLPDGTTDAYLFNPITSFTLRVRTFAMGRPEFISYY